MGDLHFPSEPASVTTATTNHLQILQNSRSTMLSSKSIPCSSNVTTTEELRSSSLDTMMQVVTCTSSAAMEMVSFTDKIDSITPDVQSYITTVHDFDVLLGRGKLYEKHIGNQNFLVLVKESVDRYVNAVTSEVKYNITLEIVDSITKKGGRFLRRGNRHWISIHEVESRKKVAQAIQYQLRKRNDKRQHWNDQDINQINVPPPPLLYRHDHYITQASPKNLLKRYVTTKAKSNKKETISMSDMMQLINMNSKSIVQTNTTHSSSLTSPSVFCDPTTLQNVAKAAIVQRKCVTSLNSPRRKQQNQNTSNITPYPQVLQKSDSSDNANHRNENSFNTLLDISICSASSCDISELLSMPIFDEQMSIDFDDFDNDIQQELTS